MVRRCYTRALGRSAPRRRFTCGFGGNLSAMRDAITWGRQSRAVRATGIVVAAVLVTFLAGYVVFGPIALRLLPR
jgi:hypothetical protein